MKQVWSSHEVTLAPAQVICSSYIIQNYNDPYRNQESNLDKNFSFQYFNFHDHSLLKAKLELEVGEGVAPLTAENKSIRHPVKPVSERTCQNMDSVYSESCRVSLSGIQITE